MRPRSRYAMRQQLTAVMLFYLTSYAVQAVPFQARDMFDPLDSLKSVAGELFSPATPTSGRLSSSNVKATTSSSLVTATAGGSSPAPVQTSGDPAPSAGDSSGTTVKSDGITVSGTSTQLSTGGVSVPSSSPKPSGTGATTLKGSVTTSPGSSGTAAVVPTTTGGDGPSTSGSGSGSKSGPGSGSGSSSSSGAGAGSSSDPGSESGPGSGSGSESGSSGSGMGSGSGSGPGTASSSDHSSGLSSGEIVAATLLPVLAFLGLIFLLVWLCPPVRRKYETWRQERMEKHAYRRALDDPVLSFGIREKGLGLGDVEQLMRPLSFGFQAPPQRPGIKRKPLNWDATRLGSDGISAIGMAVPMGGEHRRTASDSSEDEDTARYQDARSNQVSPEARIS